MRQPLTGLYTQPVYNSTHSASAFNAIRTSTTSLRSFIVIFSHYNLLNIFHCKVFVLLGCCAFITGCSLAHILRLCNGLIFKGQWSNKERCDRRICEMYRMWLVTGWHELYRMWLVTGWHEMYRMWLVTGWHEKYRMWMWPVDMKNTGCDWWPVNMKSTPPIRR